MLDANNAWADLPTALGYLSRLEAYDPYWIEEPFSPDDIERLYYISKFNDGTTICGLGDAAGYACSGILDKFRDEFEYCIEHKRSKFGGNLECLRSS